MKTIASFLLILSTAALFIAGPEHAFAEGFGLSREAQDQVVASRIYAQTLLEKHLKRSHVGLELLTAGPNSAETASAFGHTMIRLVDDNENPLDDTVIGFEMISLGKKNDTWKGLVGGNNVVVRALPFSTWLTRYVLNESRGFSRVLIPSTLTQIKDLKSLFWRISIVPNFVEDYRFVGNNCATLMRIVLQEVGFPVLEKPVEVPTVLSQSLAPALLTYAPTISTPSVTRLFADLACKYLSDRNIRRENCVESLNKSIGSSAAVNKMSVQTFLEDEGFWRFLAQRSPSEISVLFNSWSYALDSDAASTGGNIIKNHQRLEWLRASLAEKYETLASQMKTPKTPAFRLCGINDETCRNDRMKAAAQFWSVETLTVFSKNLRSLRLRSLSTDGAFDGTKWAQSAIVSDMRQYHLDISHER